MLQEETEERGRYVSESLLQLSSDVALFAEGLVKVSAEVEQRAKEESRFFLTRQQSEERLTREQSITREELVSEVTENLLKQLSSTSVGAGKESSFALTGEAEEGKSRNLVAYQERILAIPRNLKTRKGK